MKSNMMRNLKKRALALLLCSAMVLNSGVTTFAEENSGKVPEVPNATEYQCGFEEHEHEDACYSKELLCTENAEPVLTCVVEAHEHEEACYEEPVLKCEKTEHKHGEACYTAHEHGEGCYTLTCTESTEPVLVCTTEVYAHTDSCYTAHVHGEGCYGSELTCETPEKTLTCTAADCTHEDAGCYTTHSHGESCYTSVVTCTESTEPVLVCEKAEHKHGDACYTAHVHGEGCYTVTCTESTEPVLVCTTEEYIHTEACYEEPVLKCEKTEHVHDEEACYIVEHVHEAACYTEPVLICEKTVHTHTDECKKSEPVLLMNVNEGNHVCEIVETGVKYETLAAAIADANVSEGADTIRMLMSIDFDTDYMKKNQSAQKVDALSITGDVTIIGEYTISRGKYAGTLFKVPAGASLTLDGGLTIDGNNNWTFNEELYNHNLMNMVRGTNWNDYITPEENGTVANAAMFMVDGTVNVKDMSIENTYSLNSGHPLFYVKGAIAVLNMEGAQVVHCANKASNTVAYMSGSKWYIKEDTVISENYGGGNGGMCRNDSGQIYMSGGIIKDNKGHNANGSVFMMYGGGSQLIMSGGTICHNSSVIGPDNGRNAAVYLHSSSYVKMTGGTICHNIGTGRGGIDSYRSNSVLDINRVDQEFNNSACKESEAAAYTASNHPMVIDNVSLANSGSHDVGHSYNFDTWWVTGGIYTQDVDDFCAEGYVCIPYEDSERTDDYIVVPGYRVRYHAVEKIVTLDADGNENVEYNTTLVKKEFLELLRDEFWYNQDEYAEFITYTDEETGKIIDTWYTEKELLNVYDFANTALLDNLDVYGRYNPRYGYVVIEKDLENYNATMKGSAFVYEVTAEKYGDPYYKFNEVVAIEMDGTSGKYVQVGPILEDAEVTVTEIYSGAGYTKAEQSQTQTIVYSKENETPVKIVFAGSYIPGRINYGTSVMTTVKKENEI